MKVQLLIFTLTAALGHTSAQRPSRPVWVPQAPPFGAIAALAGIPDLPSVEPVAGPLVADVRIAETDERVSAVSRVGRVRAIHVGDPYNL